MKAGVGAGEQAGVGAVMHATWKAGVEGCGVHAVREAAREAMSVN